MNPPATVLNVPLKLRVNDIERHIINVDSRFRDSPAVSTSSNFYFTLLTPVRNVLRVRITSIEFPNNYHVFTEKRRNTTLEVYYMCVGSPATTCMSQPITIPDGNYTAGDMVDALNAAFAATTTVQWLTVAFDEVTGTFTFSGNQYFGIYTAGEGFDRPYDYGLGYYLGLSRKLHKGTGSGTAWSMSSDQCAYFAGDPYVFLCLNDFHCVRQTVQIYDVAGRNRLDAADFQALAKIVLREPKNYMAFDDYASQHVKEVVFPSPVDLNRLRIQVLDPYGEVMDLCSSQISFSIEVLEVKNASLYNTIRDSLALHYI
jgi:hypothetical protein